jgi:NAD-dependent deacetylase
VLITKEEHYSDHYADYVIHGKVSDMLPLIID